MLFVIWKAFIQVFHSSERKLPQNQMKQCAIGTQHQIELSNFPPFFSLWEKKVEEKMLKLGKTHVRILGVQPAFCRKGGGLNRYLAECRMQNAV